MGFAVQEQLAPVAAFGDAEVGGLAQGAQLDRPGPGVRDGLGVPDLGRDQVFLGGQVKAWRGDRLGCLGRGRERLRGGDRGDRADLRLPVARFGLCRLCGGEHGRAAAGRVPGEAQPVAVNADAVRAEPDRADDVEGGQQIGGHQPG